MVKKMLLFFFLVIRFYASPYENNCLSCHQKLPVSIDKFFYRYLLKYSSKTRVQEQMFLYLSEPRKDKTIMPKAFISRFGIKKASSLKKEELEQALDSYWNKYKVFGKIK